MQRLLLGAFVYTTVVSIVVVSVSDHFRLWEMEVPAPVSLAVAVLLGIMLLRARIQLWLYRRAAARIQGRGRW